MKKIIYCLICIFILSGCSPSKVDSKNSIKNIVILYENSIEKIKFDVSELGIKRNKVILNLFYLPTCPHCHNEIDWLNSIEQKYDYLVINKYNVNENMNFYLEVLKKMKIDSYNVPLTIVGNDFLVGFSNFKQSSIEELIDKYSKQLSCDVVASIKDSSSIEDCIEINKKINKN